MAATFALHESNTGGETTTVATNINYGSNDSANLTPASYPIQAGNNSYEKWEKCYWSGTFNSVSNVQVYCGTCSYVTGEGIDTNLTTDTYSAAVYGAPTTTTSSTAVEPMPTSDPADENLGIGGELTGELTQAGLSDYWVTQLQTTGSTPPGDVDQKTFVIQYDES